MYVVTKRDGKPLSEQDGLFELVVPGEMLVCDVVFNPPETRLIQAARERGLPVLDGLAMLVYQGVIGFELWTGRKAPEAVMKDALRRALGVD